MSNEIQSNTTEDKIILAKLNGMEKSQIETPQDEVNQIDGDQTEYVYQTDHDRQIDLEGQANHEVETDIESQTDNVGHTVKSKSGSSNYNKQDDGLMGIDAQEPTEAPNTKSESEITHKPRLKHRKRLRKYKLRKLKKSTIRTYRKTLRDLTQEWEYMMVRIHAREREEERLEKEKEFEERKKWDAQLLEQHIQAVKKVDSDLLIGFKKLIDEQRE